MGCENGEWIMRGVAEDDPHRIKSAEELIEYIDEVGILPLFRNEISDFSVEDRTVAEHWWSGNIDLDPWEWRGAIARSGRVAYGKFFHGKACCISLKWLPDFINFRRDGYDFDSRCDEGLVPHKLARIMACFENASEQYSNELKAKLPGEKYLDAAIGELQMQTYLVIRDFRQRLNKKGLPYGWAIGVYATPESIWGGDFVTSAYFREPSESLERLISLIRSQHPELTEKDIIKVLK
ncbi:MAG: hypothetical protein Q4A83_06005 [Bacillota bacterium]|nr:hypothetical protein [Bacillota bacterium]